MKSPHPFMNLKRTRIISYRGMEWIVLPGVFPPHSSFNHIKGLSKRNREMFFGKAVLELGSGCGLRSVLASLTGASSVVASDILPIACKNTRLNCLLHNRTNIRVIESDLFEKIRGTFDAIIAYLPSINHPVTKPWEIAYYDPGFVTHKKLLSEAKRYLNPGGKIHLLLLNEGDKILKGLIRHYGYCITRERQERRSTGLWNFVEISLSLSGQKT